MNNNQKILTNNNEIENKLSRTDSIEICFDETDFKNRLKPSSYLQYFQDATSRHYYQLGLDQQSMAKKDMFWLLSRITVIIDHPITDQKTLTINTSMRKGGAAEAMRDYYILSNNKIMARAVSRWCVLNSKTRKICPTADYLPFNDNQYVQNPAIDPQIIKTAPMRLNENDKIALTQPLKVRHSDLDANFHMNNARYGDIIFNACDLNQLSQHNIKAFDIHFKAELKPDTNFIINRADINNYSIFQSISEINSNPNPNQIFFHARIEWDF